MSESLLEQAKTLHAARRLREAALLYRAVLEREPSNGEAWHLLGVMALQNGEPQTALGLIRTAVELEPRNTQAVANLGTAHWRCDQLDAAVAAYDRALELEPNFAGAWQNRGAVLARLGRHDAAAESFAQAYALQPGSDFALGSWFEAQRYGADWRDFERRAREISDGSAAGGRIDRPFSFLSVCGSAQRQRTAAATYGRYLVGNAGAPLWQGERYGHTKIRVAYVSADFRDHVVPRLLTPIWEAHDRERFEVIGVALASVGEGTVVERARRSFAEFVDGSALNDADLARRLRGLEVDIAVDLTGYTAGCRLGVFARRPAPAQVNFFGFPGTLGVPYMDYLIADEFVVPASHRAFYAEHIISMPDTFQANGERSTPATQLPVPPREAAGLPAQGVVLVAFSNTYKLNPTMFAVFMRILHAVPDGVLWLLDGGGGSAARLRAAAVTHGVEARRLVFAPRVGYLQHLARLSLGDLFLDTLPYNAGITASDALWSGVPVLTCAGDAFAARMAGSVLRAADLPDLIAANLADYERLAIELALDGGRLAELKARLRVTRASSRLFDQERFRRHLEAAYVEIARRTAQGLGAASFAVPEGPP